MVAELACVLTVSEQAAGALLGRSQTLTTSLPLTLNALQAGTISWAHARIMVDETSHLDRSGAVALEAHFLDPDAPNPARGCQAGDLVPGRFRAKARTWRERHHPVSIETRHTKCAADRRVEFRPDSDGMAWFSAYLPAVTAAGIWERTTAAARARPGPAGSRRAPDPDPAPRRRRRHLAPGPRPRPRHRRHRRMRGCAGPAGAGPGHRPGPVPARRRGGTGDARQVRADPAVHGRALIADGAESFHRVLTNRATGPAGNRTDQLPPPEAYAPMAPAARRPMPLPGL
jgi:hypothetical protein